VASNIVKFPKSEQTNPINQTKASSLRKTDQDDVAELLRTARRWLLSPDQRGNPLPVGLLPPNFIIERGPYPIWVGWLRDVLSNLSPENIQKVASYAAELAGVVIPAAPAEGGKVVSLAEYRERRVL